jgi:hypothetical protein
MIKKVVAELIHLLYTLLADPDVMSYVWFFIHVLDA